MSGQKQPKPLSGLDQVLSLFGEGRTVVLHSGFAEPIGLAHQLALNADALDGVEVYSLMPMGAAPYAGEAAARHLSVHTFFPGKGLRGAVNDGRARIDRMPLSVIPKLFANGRIKADVLMLQLSPPDEAGNMSFGISLDYMRAVLEQSPVVIAEINPRMPRTCGDTTVREDQVDYIFEAGAGPQTMAAGAADDTDRRIADNIAGLIGNGAVLQTGIGAIPDLVLPRLTHLTGLGIHTGIVTDALVPLLASGAVGNGTCVTTMAGGTQGFYDFLNDNSEIEFHPCSLTHDFDTLAKIEGLCAINGALQADLSGNVNAETVDGRVISAPGGFPDFARGASAAPGGMSIVALRATSADGESSNIVASLPEGVPATVAAPHIGFIVTEHGVARLRGLDAGGRRAAMLAVAGPGFREDQSDGFQTDGRSGPAARSGAGLRPGRNARNRPRNGRPGFPAAR